MTITQQLKERSPEAFVKGQEARRAGKPMLSNPYIDGDPIDYGSWIAGYYREEAALRTGS